MILYVHVWTVASIVFHVLLAVGVYQANPKRSRNRCLSLLCLSMAAYAGALEFTFLNRFDAAGASLGVALSCFFGMTAIYVFNLLRLSISHPQETVVQLLGRARLWTVVLFITGLLSASPWLLEGMVLPGPENGLLVPEPVHGPVYPLVNLLLGGGIVWLLISFIRDARRVSGGKKTEVLYLVVGAAACLFTGLFTAVLTPHLFDTSQSATLIPLSLVAMELIVAYGIAKHRILAVGEFLRQATAYGLMGLYLVVLYGGVWQLGDLVLVTGFGLPDSLSHMLAGAAMAFSLAPAHGWMQTFANKLFVSLQPVDVKTAIHKSNSVLQSLKPLDELLDRFATVVGGTMGADQVKVFLPEGDGSFRQFYPTPAVAGAARLELDGGIRRELQQAPAPFSAETIERQRPTPSLENLASLLEQQNCAAAVGIHSHGTLEGIMLLGRRLSGRMYSKTDLEALQLLSAQLGVAIENARLYSTVQQSKVYNDILLENLVSGVVAVDADGRITTFNQEAQRITGLRPEDVVGRSADILPAEFVEVVDRTCAQQAGVRDRELTIRRVDDEEIMIRVGSALFQKPDADGSGVLIVFHDVSALRRLESQVRRSDRLAMIGTVAAGMAHEIKNPLVAIKTFTQLLPDRYDEEEFRDTFSSLIAGEVTRIDSIVNQMLDFARPSPPILSQVHVHQLLESLMSLLQHQFRKKGVFMQSRLQADDDVVTADANQLEQAMMNLLLNALDATDRGDSVTVSTSNQPDPATGEPTLALNVEDTGSGIGADKLGRIFDPFFTTKQNGTGLGLSVTHRIIEDHDGRLEVHSEKGQGTSFRATFPSLEQLCELAS